MKKVMVFGTFDIFHQGHKYFLQHAKKYGDYLIIIIARDATVKKIKGKLPNKQEEQRRQEIIKFNLANEVILGNFKNKYQIIKNIKPDIICLGYDQKYFVDKLEEKLQQYKLDKIKIIRLKPFKPHKYKTSILKGIAEMRIKHTKYA